MDRVDARKLTAEGRALLRQMVVRLRKQSGMTCAQLAQVAGVHVRTVEVWLKRAHTQGAGSLGERRRGRPVGFGRKLTMADEMWIRDRIMDHRPEQMKLDFALWSRPAIRALVRSHFGIELQDRLIGKYLKRWGFTPQRPIKRALEQRPEAISRWLKDTYPAVCVRAKAQGALIYWGDETAVKEDANWIRGYAPRGKTPVLATPTRWRKLSMISAISPRGEIAFRIVEGSINTDRFIEFLGALIQGAQRKIFLVVDNLRVHHAKRVSEWLADKADRIELVFLPPYAPESNPDEYLNRDFKTALRSAAVSKDVSELLEKATAFMRMLCTMPERVKAYFRHPSAAYAAQGI
jgi:transposase